MKRLPAFSVILIFVVLIIVGAGMVPLLNIQYAPSSKVRSLSVSFSWPGASAKLVEMEVTSKLEGVISSVQGVKDVTSVSRRGSGQVTAMLKKVDDVDMIRFEISTLIRQIAGKFPDGVSYPQISGTARGTNTSPILTYTVNADLPTQQIETYVQEHIVKELAMVDGVNSVDLSGASPFYREISFDSKRLAELEIRPEELSSAISGAFSDYNVIGSMNQTGILLKYDLDPERLEEIPVKNVEGRIVRVGDVATIRHKELEPSSYYRINGLNTINISVYAEQYVNTLEVCAAVREKMASLEPQFPEKFSVIIAYDSSVDLKSELNKVIRRTVLSLVILLLFVYLVSRSFRYLFVISLALAANIFIAFIFYVMFDMEIHLYSLAGITVSLGIIIDTSIVMIAHYGYYHNRKVFIAILAAQLTSIGALVVVFLLPESQRANLIDFSGVIIINLAISLFVSMLLIPALADTVNVKEREMVHGLRGKRRTLKFNYLYEKYIYYAKRYKWATFVLLILGFGLPVMKLPKKLGSEAQEYSYYADRKQEVAKDNLAVKIYNKTLGSDFFNDKIKEPAYKILGGSLRLFLKNLHTYGGGYRDVARPRLTISSSLPDGCTASQLNEIVLSMENYLSQFDEIEMFRTSISGHDQASILVTFRKDVEFTYFPIQLKQEIISKANVFGGANWSVYGIDQNSFNNYVYTGGYKSERIVLTGYNYDQLYGYCLRTLEELAENRRVSGADIFGKVTYGNSLSRSEYFIQFDPDALAIRNLDLQDAYSSLNEQLYEQTISSYYDQDGNLTPVKVVSSEKEFFDVWNLQNEYIRIGDRKMKFSDIGRISKRSSGNDIYRSNQQYSLIVAYDYIGSYDLARRVRERTVEWLNNSVLPVGYKAEIDSYDGDISSSNQIVLLLIIIGIIYLICSVLFESLRYPLVIIGMIPVSFIGVFLIFAITGCRFDQGGFASLVMLSGIVVNAGIYILNELYGQNLRGEKRGPFYGYLRAFNHKIVPILLTVLSTLLGLLPFLFDGPDEVFWFAFALGTIGGLLFSLIALVFFMPVWIPVPNWRAAAAGPKKRTRTLRERIGQPWRRIFRRGSGE